MSEIRTRKNDKYINNENIGLGMLNRSKVHLNRFGTIQVVKNYREILKPCYNKEKHANEGGPILKPVGPSSLCKTVKNLNSLENQFNTIKETPTDSIRKLKLSNSLKIMLDRLNVSLL